MLYYIQILPLIGGAASIKNILIHCTYLNFALEVQRGETSAFPASHLIIIKVNSSTPTTNDVPCVDAFSTSTN